MNKLKMITNENLKLLQQLYGSDRLTIVNLNSSQDYLSYVDSIKNELFYLDSSLCNEIIKWDSRTYRNFLKRVKILK